MTPESLVLSLADTPYSLEVNETTRPLIDSLIVKASDLEARYRAAHDRVGRLLRTDPEFRAFQTYHSNKLELQGPDLGVTQKIIEEYTKQGEPDDLRTFATIQAVTSDTHLVEVLGQHQANILVERISDAFTGSEFLQPRDIRQLNYFCIQHKFYAGEYRETDRVNIDQFFDDEDPLWFSQPLSHPVEVTWTDIPDEIRKICDYMSQDQECPILAAAVAHAWFTRVHPFHDGNGRTARLIANLVLVRNGWPPLTITKQNRDDYIDALRESDSGGDIRLLFDLFVSCMERGLAEIESPEFWRRRYRLEIQKNEVQRYSDWVEVTRIFVNSLRFSLADKGWTLERVTIPDQLTFQLLEAQDPTASVPLGWLRHPDRREIKVHVGYMSRELRQSQHFDPTIDGKHYPPTFYLRERNYLSNSDFPFVHRRESRILVREFTFIPGLEERRQAKVLYGGNAPTPIEMSNDELCKLLVNEIEELKLPGHIPRSYLSNEIQDFLDTLDEVASAIRISSWRDADTALLDALSEGRLLRLQLEGPGVFMSTIGSIASEMQKKFPFLGQRQTSLATELYSLLCSTSYDLTLVCSSHHPPHPILVTKEGARGRPAWSPGERMTS